MLLPVLSLSDAAAIWDARNNAAEINLKRVNLDYVGDGDEYISDLELATLVDELKTVQHKYDGKNMKSVGGQIDSEIIRPIHSFFDALAEPYQLGRVGFWCWLSNIAYDGYFWDFIKWRFDGNQTINWGITSQARVIEVYFYRAWLRGHKMLEPELENPYEYAERGASDVWRSQILRQDFGRDKEFVKAFLDSVYDQNNKTIIGTTELRTKLIPALRAWTSNASFSHLSYDECLSLIGKLRTQEV